MKFVDKWIELEKVVLGEVTKTSKDKHNMYSLVSGYYL